jgi:uncharacterized membrane protein YgdD (TMEM256/DUF423 family)
MHKTFLVAGAFFAATGVALGAFGAHGLQSLTSDEKILRSFHTAVQYQMYHAFALLIAGLLTEKNSSKFIRWSGHSFIAGIFLFSGSLYFLALLKTKNSAGVSLIGPVTPLGGLFFIAGWLFFLTAILRKK